MTSKRDPLGTPKTQSVEELEAAWEAKGPEAIKTLRTYDPAAYLRAIAALIGDDD